MSQTTSSVDADFVATLQSDISGRYFKSADRFAVEKIEDEFRKAVKDYTLLADEQFMYNLMFLVRKKEVAALLEDVRDVCTRPLKPRAEVSALKTLYALGTDEDRMSIDDRISRFLQRQLRAGQGIPLSPYLEAAERVGGAKTLTTLKECHSDAAHRQKEAENATPRVPSEIGQLDRIRSTLANQVDSLSTRVRIEGLDKTEAAREMAQHYLQRTTYLEFWSYKQLVDDASPTCIDAVRSFVSRRLGTLMPQSGLSSEAQTAKRLDLRLRGVCLLEAMGASLTAEEQKLLDEHAEMLQERGAFFRPGYDWGDALDRQ